MHEGDMWGWGMGWVGLLFWIVLILLAAVAVKYLLGGSGRDR